MSRIQRSIVAVVGVVALMGPGSPATASGAGSGTDLSTWTGIEQYLRSVGIDPAQAVWQVGQLNYAGPNCPGLAWNCTTATDRPIVQIALNGGTNEVSCTPDERDCKAVQAGNSGNNMAHCTQNSNENPAMQTCMITQETATEKGKNLAVVHQVIGQKGAASQTGSQSATVSQTSDAGNNEVNLDQRITQATSQGTVQTQESEQTSTVDQTSDEGSNAASVLVRLDQKEQATGSGGIVQGQNAFPQGADPCTAESSDFPPPEADQCTLVDQLADEGGNDVQLDHVLKQTQGATSPTGPVTQTQGSSVGGQEAHLHQNGEDVSTKFADQTETQVQSRNTAGPVFATQFDPMRCCNDQFDNPSNVTDIDQVSTQTSPGANQFIEMDGDCETSGNCTVNQTATQNGETTTNSDEGTSVHINIDCVEGECFPTSDGEIT
jgi:hypothetical protein